MTRYRYRGDDSSCFQCDMDIAHVCYARQPRARWGWTDEAVATLEAAQQLLSRPTAPARAAERRSVQPTRGTSLKSKRRAR